MADLTNTLLPAGRRIGREWHVGSLRDDPGESLKIVIAGAKAGQWQDFASGDKGDALGLVKAVRRCTIQEACAWATQWLGMPDRGGQPLTNGHDTRSRKPVERTAKVKILKLWQLGVTVAGTLGEVYLQRRGISVDPGPWVRFVAELPYWHTDASGKPVMLDTYPALLCGVAKWGSVEPIAVHRIYLQPDGSGKAQIRDPGLPDKLLNPKKTMGSNLGGAVRLSRYDEDVGILMIGEGVETMLSVLQLDPSQTGVWACLGTATLAQVELPETLRDLLLASDGNGVGHEAAKKLIQRAKATRPNLEWADIIGPPSVDDDWNDTLKRLEAVRE